MEPVPLPDFAEAQAKLQHACAHIANVEALIASYLSTDFYRISFEPNKREGIVKVNFQSLHQPGKQINAAIGDAIGNLRSVLDYLTVAITRPLGANPEKVAFPFADNEQGFIGEANSARCFSIASKEIIEILVNELQPYKGGNGHTLWVLNKLRNIDKHRFLVAVTQIAGFKASWVAGGNIFINGHVGVKIGDKGCAIVAPSRDFYFTEDPRPTFEVEFAEPGVIERKPVIEFLHIVASQISRLLNRMEVATNGGAG